MSIAIFGRFVYNISDVCEYLKKEELALSQARLQLSRMFRRWIF